MSISDRLDEIDARLNYEGVMDEEADYRALCEDAPAMLAALRAALDVCDRATLQVRPYGDGEPYMIVSANEVRNAIEATLQEGS